VGDTHFPLLTTLSLTGGNYTTDIALWQVELRQKERLPAENLQKRVGII
jgi:hypothetical protein